MKTVILCGGAGTRLSEETLDRPKPMVKIGEHPIIWHIMKIFESQGYEDFFLPIGYKGNQIADYIMQHHYSNASVVDTGQNTLTGGRLLRLKQYLYGETFMLTYGDGVADVDIHELLRFHKQHGRLCTVTAVQPPGRFGALELIGDTVLSFHEKPRGDHGWINGGFFVFEPGIFDLLETINRGDQMSLEREPMDRLAAFDQLRAFRHKGYWQCMDTLRDKKILEKEWASGRAGWKTW